MPNVVGVVNTAIALFSLYIFVLLVQEFWNARKVLYRKDYDYTQHYHD